MLYLLMMACAVPEAGRPASDAAAGVPVQPVVSAKIRPSSSPGPVTLVGEIDVEIRADAPHGQYDVCRGEVRFTIGTTATQEVVGTMTCRYFYATEWLPPRRADFVGSFVDETTIVGEAYFEIWDGVSFVDWTATYDGTTLTSSLSGETALDLVTKVIPASWTTRFTATR